MLRWIGRALIAATCLCLPAVAVAEDGDARRSGPVLDYSGKDLRATLHYYVDDAGRYHFTNRPELVPPRYRPVALTLFVAPSADG